MANIRKITVNENEKGLLFNNGKFQKLLNAGAYRLFGGKSVEIIDVKEPLESRYIDLDELLTREDVKSAYTPYEVKEDELLIMYLNGKVNNAFSTGKYAFYNGLKDVKYEVVSIKDAEISLQSAFAFSVSLS